MDQLNVERLHIPTLTIVTTPFVQLAKVVAAGENALDFCIVAVPHPMGQIPKAEIEKRAEEAYPQILKLAAEWRPSVPSWPGQDPYPAERFEIEGTVEDVNGFFLAKRWSLGLPVVPPTGERIAEMLKGTSRKPAEVLGQVPPRMASLTIELVAAHAVMAGGKPAYMPVLIAALEALLAPEANWRGALATTGTTQFLVIVNGPIVKEVGLAYGQGAAGKGHHPNASIGYAINLIAYAVGGSRPPLIDKSTLGSPSDFVCWVFGENEDNLPSGWQPLHVDRGFRKSDSVVTVMCTYPPVDSVNSSCVAPEEHVRWWRYIVSPLLGIGGPCHPSAMKLNPIVALAPEPARLIASAGWTKDHFRRAFWDQTRIPLSAWPAGCAEMKNLTDILGPVTPESLIPIALKPEQLLIVVVGGEGPHSHYFAPFIGSYPVSHLATN